MKNSLIEDIKAWQILDSRGNPTLKVKVETKGGDIGIASVPSGASVGLREAFELRDNNKNFYGGKSVFGAVRNINENIRGHLCNKSVINQYEIDNTLIELDGTENKSNLGANAILGVSLASVRAASSFFKIPLYKYIGGIFAHIMPTFMANIINGGVHGNSILEFQEFMITILEAKTFSEAVQIGEEIFFSLKSILKEEKKSILVGDEGGFSPDLKTNKEALDLIVEAIKRAGYSLDNVKICLDIASSEFYKDGFYEIKSENLKLKSEQMAQYLKNLIEDYPIISIEDGMAQDDFEGWKILTDLIGKDCLLVGDDLFVTNKKLLSEGIKNKIANSILIKPNQIGTLSETLETIWLAKKSGYKTIISHRSGETDDTFISDLAVAVNSGLIKIGSFSRFERVAKYNRLIEIEDELYGFSKYLGGNSYFNNYPYNFRKCGG